MLTKNLQENKTSPVLRFKNFEDAWEEKSYGDVFSFYTTNSYSRDDLNYISGEVKNIHYGDIHTKFKTLFNIRKENVPFINKEILLSKISIDNYCQVGDLVIADASEDYDDIGKSIEIINLDNQKVLAGLHTFLARPQPNKTFLGFSGYLMQSRRVRLQIMKIAQGTKVFGLSTTRLSKVKLSIPQLNEQQKIAEFLCGVDEWIENLKEQKENLELYKKVLLQKVLSQEVRFKNNKGEYFSEWVDKKVGDIFEITRGYVLAVKNMNNFSSEKYKYPTYSSQTKNNGLIGYYDQFLYEDAITWTTDGANAGDVNFRKGKFYCTNVCGVLVSKEGYANRFTAELLNSVTKRYVSYVGNPKLMNNVMAQIKVKFPSVTEQEKIADFLTSIDKVIESKQQQIFKAEEWKKGLMQVLFV